MLSGPYLGRGLDVSGRLDCLPLNAGFCHGAFGLYARATLVCSRQFFLLAYHLQGLPSQRMNMSALLLVKRPIRQGHQAAGHLRSQMHLSNALRRLFASIPVRVVRH